MKLNSKILALAALVTAAVVSCNFNGNGDLKQVSWIDIRAEIAKYICVAVDTLPNGHIGYYFNTGTGEKCINEQLDTPLTRAVKIVLKKANPLLRGIKPEYVGFTYTYDSASIEESSINLQNAYLSSNIFLRPILNRLKEALSSQGLVCQDCPILEQKPVRPVTWEKLKNYLAAYAWPVKQDVRDEYGNPTGDSAYFLYVCIGNNGISKIENPDQYLAYVGFTIAINSPKFLQLASKHFNAIFDEKHFQELPNEQKIKYLQEQLPTRLKNDKRLLPIACSILKRYFNDIKIQLNKC